MIAKYVRNVFVLLTILLFVAGCTVTSPQTITITTDGTDAGTEATSDVEARAAERIGILCATEAGNCVESWGSDILVYSDTGSTLEFQIDASAGLVDLNGSQLDLDADGDTSITASTDDQIDFEIAGTDEVVLTAASLDLNNTIIAQYQDTENLMLPTVLSVAVEYTTTAAIATVADGEIWIVHDVIANITTNYDCTGDNCTFQVGDGNDPNGLLDLVDAELQTADTEGTGWAAGWQGSLAATKGAYLAVGNFVYAPSGSAETIDFAVGGTDPAGGAATIYIIYTRIQ